MAALRMTITILAASIVAAGAVSSAEGQRPQPKRKITREAPPRKQAPQEMTRIRSDRSRSRTARVRYVPTSPRFRHVRVIERELHDNRLPDSRTVIVRSTAVRPRVLVRFENRRQDEVRSVIRLYRGGDRTQALQIWGRFVTGLADYDEPVDLDEIMMYVARECCFHEDDATLFRAQRLAFLRDSGDRLDDYIEQLEERRVSLARRGGASDVETLGRIESELARARAERDIVDIRVQLAEQEYETGAYISRDYEARFGGILTDLYREAGRYIRITSSTTHICTPDCLDHYFDGEQLIFLRGHRHGPGCGHVWNGRYWVPETKRKVLRP
jgi:hypothetical protein